MLLLKLISEKGHMESSIGILMLHKDISCLCECLLKGQASSTGEVKQGKIVPWLPRINSMACKTGGPVCFLVRIYGLEGYGQRPARKGPSTGGHVSWTMVMMMMMMTCVL